MAHSEADVKALAEALRKDPQRSTLVLDAEGAPVLEDLGYGALTKAQLAQRYGWRIAALDEQLRSLLR